MLLQSFISCGGDRRLMTQEQLIQELENLLVPYALSRFDLSKGPQAALLKGFPMMGKLAQAGQNRLNQLITWLARAFIRTIVYTNRPMFLRDIATVALGEAMYMLNVPPYMFSGSDEGGKADLKITAETEIHRWLLFLVESGKLPGNYHRYLGIYEP